MKPASTSSACGPMIAIFAMSRLRGRRPFSFLSSVTDAAASRLESSTPSAATLRISAGFSGDVRVLEQAEGKLVAQHAAYGPVQNRFRYFLVAHGLGQHLPVAVDGWRLDVHAGRESEQPRLLGGFRPPSGASAGS